VFLMNTIQENGIIFPFETFFLYKSIYLKKSYYYIPKGRDSRWYTVVVGVRLTDGLKGTVVQRPSSPALKQYRLPNPFSFSVVQR
jgi:hypothetical protein